MKRVLLEVVEELTRIRADFTNGLIQYTTDDAIYALQDMLVELDNEHDFESTDILENYGLTHQDSVISMLSMFDNLSEVANFFSEYEHENQDWKVINIYDNLHSIDYETMLDILDEVDEYIADELKDLKDKEGIE